MSKRLVSWLGLFNFLLCSAAFLAMWGLYFGLHPSVTADLSEYTKERWFAFGPLIAYPFVGALIVHYRPENSIGQIFAAIGLSNAVYFLSTPYLIHDLVAHPNGLPFSGEIHLLRNSIWVFQLMGFPTLLLLFPTGRLLSRRWGYMLAAILTAAATMFVYGIADGWSRRHVSPFTGAPGAESEVGWLVVPFVLLLLSIPVSLVSLVFRWRRAGDHEKQQMKWLLFGGITTVAALSLLIVPDMLRLGRFETWLETLVSNIAFLALPVAVGFAVLRYRLWDIDVLIRRTLQYALLTGLLALVYLGGIISLQALLGSLTGNADSPLVTVITTLGIAALFSPLRRRVQGFIDRRLYRRKYDAEQTLAAYAAAARSEVDINRLAHALVSLVEETMQPQAVSLWLRREARRTI